VRTFSCLISCLALGVLSASAQTTMNYPLGSIEPYIHETGPQDNPSDEFQVVASQIVTWDGSVSMRLYYSTWYLDGDSFVRVTSLLDHDVQELNAEELREWSSSSSYFNGDSVLLELVAAPNTTGSFVNVKEVGIIVPDVTGGNSGECGICGNDDRTQTNLQYSCRMMPAGCSASIYTTDSCAVSAGHCIGGGQVLQFNVPNSLSNCTPVNPASIHQYPVTGQQSVNGGVGNDWAVLTVGTSSGLRPYQRYNTLRRIANTLVAASSEIYGYGVDNTCFRSQTQQRSPGTITGQSSNYWVYNNDIRGGNSGSGLLAKQLIFGIVTHCDFSCTNIATKHTVTAFVNARNALCPPCVSDLNGDNVVGQADLGLLLSGFGLCWDDAGFIHQTDLDGNGCTDQGDLGIFLGDFGSTCP